jgi:hypothetical protein
VPERWGPQLPAMRTLLNAACASEAAVRDAVYVFVGMINWCSAGVGIVLQQLGKFLTIVDVKRSVSSVIVSCRGSGALVC